MYGASVRLARFTRANSLNPLRASSENPVVIFFVKSPRLLFDRENYSIVIGWGQANLSIIFHLYWSVIFKSHNEWVPVIRSVHMKAPEINDKRLSLYLKFLSDLQIKRIFNLYYYHKSKWLARMLIKITYSLVLFCSNQGQILDLRYLSWATDSAYGQNLPKIRDSPCLPVLRKKENRNN